MIGVNLTDRDYWYVAASGPGHNPADSAQNPAVIPYAHMAVGQEEIPLCVYVYEDLLSPSFKQLTDHFRFPSNITPHQSYNSYAFPFRRFVAVIE
jgi:hypothetical protein